MLTIRHFAPVMSRVRDDPARHPPSGNHPGADDAAGHHASGNDPAGRRRLP